MACRAEALELLKARAEVRLRPYGGFGATAFTWIHERRLVDLTGIEPVTS